MYHSIEPISIQEFGVNKYTWDGCFKTLTTFSSPEPEFVDFSQVITLFVFLEETSLQLNFGQVWLQLK